MTVVTRLWVPALLAGCVAFGAGGAAFAASSGQMQPSTTKPGTEKAGTMATPHKKMSQNTVKTKHHKAVQSGDRDQDFDQK